MKAQSAIEYLTIYGWMLIAVAIVGGAVYSVTGQECVETSTGFQSSSLSLTDFGLMSNQSLGVVLENRRSEKVQIDRLVLEGKELDVDEEIDSGREGVVEIQGFEESDQCSEMEIGMIYSIGGLTDQKISGELVGGYEPGMDTPESPGQLSADFTG